MPRLRRRAAKEKDLATDYSCPDWANPCKHVAATHYVLGEAFDKDPFLLFELRGRGKDAVLEALRKLRAGRDWAEADVVGSLEHRVLVTARQFPEHGVGTKELTAPGPLEIVASSPSCS